MRILIALALALAVMAGLVVLIVMLGATLSRAVGEAAATGPVRSGLLPKVAFGLLWLLIAGIAAGLIGSA